MNMKDEFLLHVKGRPVIAVRIFTDLTEPPETEFDHGDDIQNFLDELDFECSNWDSEIRGTIWFADGNWSTIATDYETGEWYWRLHVKPGIPLKRT